MNSFLILLSIAVVATGEIVSLETIEKRQEDSNQLDPSKLVTILPDLMTALTSCVSSQNNTALDFIKPFLGQDGLIPKLVKVASTLPLSTLQSLTQGNPVDIANALKNVLQTPGEIVKTGADNVNKAIDGAFKLGLGLLPF